jgi:hypothetical protein
MSSRGLNDGGGRRGGGTAAARGARRRRARELGFRGGGARWWLRGNPRGGGALNRGHAAPGERARGGAAPGCGRARVQLGREEGDDPDRWGHPASGYGGERGGKGPRGSWAERHAEAHAEGKEEGSDWAEGARGSPGEGDSSESVGWAKRGSSDVMGWAALGRGKGESKGKRARG